MAEKRYIIDNPTLMEEWNWEKNSELGMFPDRISHASHLKAWWTCKEGHTWDAKVANRAILHRGCPHCFQKNRGVKKSTPLKRKSLQEVNYALSLEWHPLKNGSLTPADVYPNARRTVWWKCEKGHEWQAAIYSRNTGIGCPQCQKHLQSSFPEKALFFYVSKYFADALENYRSPIIQKWELDVYIPSLNVGIEYDGDKWHQNLERDYKKNEFCELNEIHLFRIREPMCPQDCNTYKFVHYIHLKNTSKHELEKSILTVLKHLGVSNAIVNLSSDNHDILKLLNKKLSAGSILCKAPHLLQEWDYSKNGDLSPENLNSGTKGKFYWICPIGHSYQSTVAHRMGGNGCSVCAGKKVVAGVNDLESQYPQLVKEWHPDNTLLPSKISAQSHKKFLWICPKGHTYLSDPHHRVRGTGCPVCVGKVIIEGYNDLATIRPELVKEWHPLKNLPLMPTKISKSSGKKVWWLCSKCGHEWPAAVNKRAAGRGCPNCYAHSRRNTMV